MVEAMEKQEPLGAGLARAIEGIVAEGREVRKRVAAAVEGAVQQSAGAIDALVDVARATADGAAAGIERVRATERGQTLGEVLDGLGDGLGRAAHGASLAIEEAAARGKAFASEDVERMRGSFESLRAGLADAVREPLSRLSRETREGLGDLGAHASRTFEGARPGIEAALAALRRDPAGAARGAASASASAAREATGALFTSLARLLERGADRLRDDRARGDGPKGT